MVTNSKPNSMKTVKGRRVGQWDHWLIISVILLVGIGLILALDTSFPTLFHQIRLPNGGESLSGNQYAYLIRFAGAVLVGIAVAWGVMRVDIQTIRHLAPLLFWGSVILLLLVYVPHVGIRHLGGSRWLGYKIFQIQPSELAKVATIIYITALICSPHNRVQELTSGYLYTAGVLCIAATLITFEPDLGTASTLFIAGLFALYMGNAKKRYVLLTFLLAGVVLIGLVSCNKERRSRIMEFLDHKHHSGYQIHNSKLAIGSGGVMGVGIGNGKGKYFVPESNTDFVFPTWAEETGFVGSALLLLLEFTVGWRGFVISWRSPDPYSRLLAASFSAMFSLQALLNIAVVTGLWPVTGVPLPFISYGGTSILCSFLIIGLLLRIQRETALRVNR